MKNKTRSDILAKGTRVNINLQDSLQSFNIASLNL